MRTLSRRKVLAQWPLMPTADWSPTTEELEYSFPSVARNWVLWLEAKSVRGCLRELAKEIEVTADRFGSATMIFMGAETWPWRGQSNNTYPPVVRALSYLEENGVGPRFSGGLSVPRHELAKFVPHLGWLTRCNAGLPYVYFTDESHQFIAHVCKQCNLHLEALTPSAEAIIEGSDT
ncbi:hypothetical protein HJ590_15185 [Naumannella sp. ID2617S]|nr:hypothetical protein [Naumannella sp. ID2617S]